MKEVSEREVIAVLASQCMAKLNEYFTGKNGKVDDKKILIGKQFWDIQEEVWEDVKKRIGAE